MKEFFTAIGGMPGCRKLCESFYARLERDPLLRPMFPGKTMRCAIDGLAAFLVQLLEGPPQDAKHRVWTSLRQSHARFRIGTRERDAWMVHMAGALAESDIAEPVREALLRCFEEASAYLVNEEELPAPAGKHALSDNWSKQVRIDNFTAALRRGEAPPVGHVLAAIALRRGGRTLLHEAAAAGCLAAVEEMLRLGMDPNVPDGGGHTPLYSTANECKRGTGASIVRVLVATGAGVNAAGGIQRCTPLHMAARRGNVAIAQALLECGAGLNLRDKGGATPLRRAINCKKASMVEFLISQSASL